MDFFRTITLIDVLDVAVLTTLIYQVLLIFKRTRASQLILGLLYFALIFFVAFALEMNATRWVFERMIGLMAIGLIIIFQPELRNFFERAGRRGIMLRPSSQQEQDQVEDLLTTVIQALEEMSEVHTGAIIVIERDISLNDYITTGERIDANIRKDLLKSIFYKGNPLHDGAVILKAGRIASARSFLPLSESHDIPSHFGTRHRAALGITEQSDAVSLVASEETGHLSLFTGGKPAFRLSPNTMKHMAKGILVPGHDKEPSYFPLKMDLGRYFRRKPRVSVKEPGKGNESGNGVVKIEKDPAAGKHKTGDTHVVKTEGGDSE